MEPAPIPKDETARLKAVEDLKLLDTPPEERFDRITSIALRLFNVPISTITLLDKNREWHKSCQGLDQRQSERAYSFCGHALWQDDIFIIEDATKDPRFADNPMVVNAPHIRFYAGTSLFSLNGQRVGTLCIKDTKPRKFSPEDQQILKDLVVWVELEVNWYNLSARPRRPNW
ncbi:hypothetical protein A3A66_04880 [Microgenomates group bacterium RIFCSPLOWO2_01_FULL_46_13]|nr:MAG: hypothetical protein A2783_02285 [Microgenomates group bacterium RIFCSPHIGHO2_01_FULL_45_11]OGV94297.1 MAG: hypothetical protein A3A66_04880 [Microgenomates group bacterium RIFCSPLOWO2_01_FULL_46_13]